MKKDKEKKIIVKAKKYPYICENPECGKPAKVVYKKKGGGNLYICEKCFFGDEQKESEE